MMELPKECTLLLNPITHQPWGQPPGLAPLVSRALIEEGRDRFQAIALGLENLLGGSGKEDAAGRRAEAKRLYSFSLASSVK